VSLRRFTASGERDGRERPDARAPAPPPGERCEMCAEPIGEEHGHVANLADRRILCACRPCALLFTHSGAGSERRDAGDPPARRFRAVPGRHRWDPGFAMPDRDWDELAIPVRMAFFFRNSAMGRTVAFYPSPGGATESELPLDAWVRVLAGNPAVADVEPDVEALLVDRDSGAYLVPIDVCYALVGLVRTRWKGFHGGDEAWEAIDAFFAALRDRCERVTGEDARG
jgi:Family of unknown function (DUF5947)